MAKMGYCEVCEENAIYEYDGYWVDDGDGCKIWVCSTECEKTLKVALKEREELERELENLKEKGGES